MKVTVAAIPPPRRLLSREHAAAYMSISPSLFDELRKEGTVGPAKLIRGKKGWDVRHLDDVIDNLPDENGDDGGWKAAL